MTSVKICCPISEQIFNEFKSEGMHSIEWTNPSNTFVSSIIWSVKSIPL
jgi:hypothetical protein